MSCEVVAAVLAIVVTIHPSHRKRAYPMPRRAQAVLHTASALAADAPRLGAFRCRISKGSR